MHESKTIFLTTNYSKLATTFVASLPAERTHQAPPVMCSRRPQQQARRQKAHTHLPWWASTQAVSILRWKN